MFEVNDIREWRNHDVVDAAGHKIGTLDSVYVDTATDQPAFAAVTVGMPTRRRLTFVPLDGARVGPGYLQVTPAKHQVKGVPSIDVHGELAAQDEPAIFAHYEMTYLPGISGLRRLARRDRLSQRNEVRVVFFLLLIIVAIVLGIVGVVAHGLFYLLIIGIVVLIIDLVSAAVRFRRAGRRPTR